MFKTNFLNEDCQCCMLFSPSCHEWTSVWKHWMSHFLRYEQPSVVCTLLGVQHLLPVSLYQWDKSIHSLRHHHSSFPSAPSPNCKHSLYSCPRLWSLTPVSYGSWSPTDVSVPRSPLGCFLAEWRHSLRVSSGDRVRPDPGHLLEESLAHQHSSGKTHMAVGHLLSKLVSCLHVNWAEQRKKWGCQESKYTFH